MVESIARVRHIRVTPMKARRVVNMIRGKQAQEALAILKFAPQGASEPVYKLVASAIANARVKADATNTYLDEQDLYISRAFVDEGTTLKRFQPRAQGRAFRINKRTSHITVVLGTFEDERLVDELKKAKEELFNLRFQSATGQLESHGRLRTVKRDIARIYTVIRERELGIRATPAPVEAPAKAEKKTKKAKAATVQTLSLIHI